MKDRQLIIPGLEALEKAAGNTRQKQKTFQQQLRDLQDRVLQLELETSVLRIQMEKERR